MLLNKIFSNTMDGGFGRSTVGGEGKSVSKIIVYSDENIDWLSNTEVVKCSEPHNRGIPMEW